MVADATEPPSVWKLPWLRLSVTTVARGGGRDVADGSNNSTADGTQVADARPML